MSVEVTVWCDVCHKPAATGPTPASTRRLVLQQRGLVNKPGGEDVCPRCAKEMRDRPSLMRQAERRWARA